MVCYFLLIVYLKSELPHYVSLFYHSPTLLAGRGAFPQLLCTCDKQLSSTSRLPRSIGGLHSVSPAVGFCHGGDHQLSAAITKRDLHTGQSCSRENLAIPIPVHLRNWETCRKKEDKWRLRHCEMPV